MENLRIKQIYYSTTEPTNAQIGDIWADERLAANIVTMFDIVYPIGSYALGNKPLRGTWVQVTGNEALWIKNDSSDGTTIAQSLPKPHLTQTMPPRGEGKHDHYWRGYATRSSYSGGNRVFSRTWISGDPEEYFAENDGAHTHDCTITVDTSGPYGSGTKVQPDAYTMTVWKRTA